MRFYRSWCQYGTRIPISGSMEFLTFLDIGYEEFI